MDSFDRFRKRVLLHAVIAAVVISAPLALVRVDYGLGFLLGAAASIVNLHLMAVRTARLVAATAHAAKGYAFQSAISRYLLLALALVVAAKLDGVNFVSAACGLFLAQAVLVGHHLLTSRSAPPALEGGPWKK